MIARIPADATGPSRAAPKPAESNSPRALVELIVLVDIEVAHFPVLGLAGEETTQ